VGIHFDHAEWERYVPKAHDNRANRPGEMCVCEIQPMTVAELRKFQTANARVLMRKKHNDEDVREVMAGVLTKRVRKIEQCYIERAIETGAELAEHGTEDLILDVFNAIAHKSVLEEGLEKKFVGPSGS
jgi:hypothetical protein